MTYAETLEYLYEHLPMYQRVGPIAYKKDLTNTRALCEYLGNPHRKFRSIHIAGTNGKGSVSHTIASILQEAGFKVGLYTSPHLKDFRERIRINGKMISEDSVINFTERIRPEIERIQPSFFEITVAMAFRYFAENQVDFAVIETGLGGRLDSTNIITPLLSIITNIGFDHQNLLGDTLPEIAREKAGIIKNNVPVVIGESNEQTISVFTQKANEENAPIYLADYAYSADYSFVSEDYSQQLFNIYRGGTMRYAGLVCDLLGLYQKKNIITVLQAVEILRVGFDISDTALYAGVANVKRNTGLEGRWQILGKNPLIVADTGHNEHGLHEVIKQIQTVPHKKLHFVFGMVNDKNADHILRLLPRNAKYYFTKANMPRALGENLLTAKAEDHKLEGDPYPSVKEAIEAAKRNAKPDDFIFIGGSTFIVAEAI